MWCIYLLFAIFLIIYAFLIIVAYGIKTSLRIDVDNLSVCVKVFIFDWVEILCFKIFVCDQQFFYQINKRNIKLLELKKDNKDKNKGKNDKKMRILSFVYYIIEKMPKIRIINPTVEYGVEIEDIKNRALFDGGVSAILNSAIGMLFDKLDVVNLSVRNVSNSSTFKGLYCEGIIKFSLIKIFLYFLHIISVKKRFQKAY